MTANTDLFQTDRTVLFNLTLTIILLFSKQGFVCPAVRKYPLFFLVLSENIDLRITLYALPQHTSDFIEKKKTQLLDTCDYSLLIACRNVPP